MTHHFEMMMHESSKKLIQKEEEEKVAAYYQNIISQKYAISTEAQKEFMMQLMNTKWPPPGKRDSWKLEIFGGENGSKT